MDKYKEKPFEYLRRKSNNEHFEDSIVRNWYLARAYVQNRLAETAFTPDSKDHLNVILPTDSPRMLFLARQVALSAHYINFKEESGVNAARTHIIIVSGNPRIKEELEKEEYLCNLPRYGNYIDKIHDIEHTAHYVDIEIDIVKEIPCDINGKSIIFDIADVNDFFDQYEHTDDDNEIFKIDTRKAMYADRVYELGSEIQNLPAENIHCAKRYALALDVYKHEKLKPIPSQMVDNNKWNTMGLCRIKEKISNIFCTDCFSLRYNSIKACSKIGHIPETKTWEQYNEALSMSEHARWVVEKLILGYRPLNDEERFHDETLHIQFNNKAKKKNFRGGLKRNDSDPAHIDLCSYSDLRRIDPDNMKYDSFLMLAIPKILDRVGENN